MTFGLQNAQTCHRFMDRVTSGLDFCFTYIEDILVAFQNKMQHKKHLKTQFSKLQHYGIVINSKKYTFGQSSVNFLGYTINAEGIKLLPEKVQTIVQFQELTITKLRRFLGILNLYNRFLKDLASMQEPLQNEIAKHKRDNNVTIIWTSELRQSFQQVKKHLAQAFYSRFQITTLSNRCFE